MGRTQILLRRCLGLVGAGLLAGVTTTLAAAPQLRVHDGSVPVIVTCLGKGSALYSHELWLENTNQFLCESGDVGRRVEAGTFPEGTELIFSLRVKTTGEVFYTGDGSRNPDGQVHAQITQVQEGGYATGRPRPEICDRDPLSSLDCIPDELLSGTSSTYRVSFEDQMNMGDHSFDNANFQITNLTNEEPSCTEDRDKPTKDGFCHGDGGWRVSGDAQGGSVRPDHKKEEWGEYIEATDDAVGGVWYWQAPGRYTGNLCDFYGGSLTYEIRQSDLDNPFDSADVVISGPAGKLTYTHGSPPGQDWTSYSVPLKRGDKWEGAADDDAFMAVLANVTDLFIRGEFRTGADVGAMNEVELSPAGFIRSFFNSTDDCHAKASDKPTVRYVYLDDGDWRPLEDAKFDQPVAIEVDYGTPQDEESFTVTATLDGAVVEGLVVRRLPGDKSRYRSRLFRVTWGEPPKLTEAFARGERP